MNPFTPRGAIKQPDKFVGRWRELSIIFERIEAGRPVLVAGAPGVGKSSLLYHVVEAAGVQLEDETLRAYYLDLALAEDAAEVLAVLVGALGWRGAIQRRADPAVPLGSVAAVEVALLESARPLLLALDNADRAIKAGWGTRLLEELARLARRADLILVASVTGEAPLLNEPFSVLSLGAVSSSEVRLLAEAYLDGEVVFTPEELRELYALSAGHPAYLQRAAYHLYEARQNPAYAWRAAYLREAHDMPIPGAPLPPEVFESEETRRRAELGLDDGDGAGGRGPLQTYELPSTGVIGPLLVLLAAPLAYLVSGSWLVAALVLALALLAVALLHGRKPR
jgi:hypothetical protein